MNKQIYAEASEWLVEFRTENPDQATRRHFDKWLSTSPEHVRAYLELSGVWEAVSAQPPAAARDIDELIERARNTTNVLPLAPEPGLSPARVAFDYVSRRRAFFASAATLLIAVLGIAAYVYTPRNTYTTEIGEQRSILLPDGSTIDLNARSKVRVRLSEHERHVDLLAGQALFRVAKDSRRPFIVAANGTRVRAVGTEFDVNRRKRGLIVTVVEGSVAVFGAAIRQGSAAPAPPTARNEPLVTGDTVLLAAGEQAVVSTHTLTQPRRADIETATAWTQRRLIFDSTPLDEVAEEFNRNNARSLVIESEGLGDFRISGAFSSSDPQPLLRFLRAQPGITVIDEQDRIVVSRNK
jgi:transmembrane sensor